jgi:hypothetical protein
METIYREIVEEDRKLVFSKADERIVLSKADERLVFSKTYYPVKHRTI